VTGASRWEGLPNIPTVAESVPNYDATAWWGIGAPKNTSVDIIQTLNTAISAGLADPKLKGRFAEIIENIAGAGGTTGSTRASQRGQS